MSRLIDSYCEWSNAHEWRNAIYLCAGIVLMSKMIGGW